MVGDHSRNGSEDFYYSRRMVQIGTKQPEMLSRGLHVDKCIVFGCLRNFEGALRNRSVGKQDISAIELYLGELFILDSLAIVGVRARDVRAPHLEQKLALFHQVAQPGIDFDDAAGGERGHRNLPRHVRIDDTCYI